MIANDKSHAIAAEIKGAAREAIEQAVSDVAAEAKRLIKEGPKTGREYGEHKASAPGEAPANLTSELHDSITHEMISDSEGMVFVSHFTATILENGTEAGHLEPRPFLTPAVERVMKDHKDLMHRKMTRIGK